MRVFVCGVFASVPSLCRLLPEQWASVLRSGGQGEGGLDVRGNRNEELISFHYLWQLRQHFLLSNFLLDIKYLETISAFFFWPKRSSMVPNWPLRFLFGDKAWGNVNCGRNSGGPWTKRWGHRSTNDAWHVSDNINNNLWQAVDSSALLWKPFLT